MTNAIIKIDLARHPLCRAEMAEDCLGIPRDKLIALIESGEIAWAWNVGLGSTRRELRILGKSVIEYQSGANDRIGATKNMSMPEVVSLVLPQRENIKGTEVQRLFSLCPDAIRKLHRAGEIEMVPGDVPTGGPNGSPRFTRQSLAGFLSKRRVT